MRMILTRANKQIPKEHCCTKKGVAVYEFVSARAVFFVGFFSCLLHTLVTTGMLDG